MTALTDAIARWEYPKTSLVKWEYRVVPTPVEVFSQHATLEIDVMTTDSYPPHNPVKITHRYVVPQWLGDADDLAVALAYLRECTKKTVLHEMDEQIRVDGVMVFDPHRDDRPGDLT